MEYRDRTAIFTHLTHTTIRKSQFHTQISILNKSYPALSRLLWPQRFVIKCSREPIINSTEPPWSKAKKCKGKLKMLTQTAACPCHLGKFVGMTNLFGYYVWIYVDQNPLFYFEITPCISHCSRRTNQILYSRWNNKNKET